MIGERTTVQVLGREMTVEMDKLTPIEIAAVARTVTQKMQQIQEENKIVDSSKLAILASLELAAELYQLQQQSKDFNQLDEKKINEMISHLQSALK